MRKLLKYMKGYGKECTLGPLFKLLEATFELFIPLVVASIIDVGITNKDSGYITWMCLIMIALGIIGLACAITAQFFAARAAVGFAGRLRHALMEHILRLDYTEIDRIGTSTMITRMTADVNQVQNGVNLTLRLLLRSPFVVFGAMVMAFTIDFNSALVFVGVIPVLCVIVFGIMLITMPMYKNVQGKLDGVTSSTRQNLTGVRVLRAFCMEEEQKESFREKTDMLKKGQLKAGRISALLNPVTFVVVNLAIILLIHVGAIRVNGGIISQGMVVALYNYMSQILVELIKMANLIITMTKAAACGNRISEMLETKPEDTLGCKRGTIKGKVEFFGVSAQYKDSAAPSIENVSFSVLPGQTVGIIGGTGSGKTTLINLIAGFYPSSCGSIKVDGHDLTSFDMLEYRKQIGIVPQNAVLFKGTIRENLLWGNGDATDNQLWDALSLAQAKEVVEGKEGGLDAMIEQGGSNLSGGQKQRLTIARALVRKPGILILDDSASALDYATDASLRKAISEMEQAPTTFIVSQRAASVRYADLILVLDDGMLVDCGTHEDLIDRCDVYREIFFSQFPKEVKAHG